MPRRRTVDDLSVDELRRLLVEKRRAEREARLEHFKRTGRILSLDNEETPADRFEEPVLLEDDGELLQNGRKRKKRGKLDYLLLAVEIGAIAGLILIIFNMTSLLQVLRNEMTGAMQQPTMTPTAQIMAVVLPGGHKPPVDETGETLPNDAEIPAHLLPLVQSIANLPVPTPGPEQTVRIQIPAIRVDAPVVQGDGWEQLKKGVGQNLASPNPGEKGNIVLSAHNDVYAAIFRDLEKLKTGDEIILYSPQKAFVYQVRKTQIVEPTQVEVMAPSKDAIVTLITCHPYMVDNKRYVVTAVLKP